MPQMSQDLRDRAIAIFFLLCVSYNIHSLVACFSFWQIDHYNQLNYFLDFVLPWSLNVCPSENCIYLILFQIYLFRDKYTKIG